MVFQLGDLLNEMNGNDPSLAVKFVPWIQSSPNVPANSNGYRLPNGRIPSAAQLRADPSLRLPAEKPSDPEAAEKAEEAFEHLLDATTDRIRNASQNIYQAHKEAIEMGHFHWSEAAYLKYALNLTDDMTDFIEIGRAHV